MEPPLSVVGRSSTCGRDSYCYRKETSRLSKGAAAVDRNLPVVNHVSGGALQFLTVSPCEVAERRSNGVSAPALLPAMGPSMTDGETSERSRWNRRTSKRKATVVSEAETLLQELGFRPASQGGSVAPPAQHDTEPAVVPPGPDSPPAASSGGGHAQDQGRNERTQADGSEPVPEPVPAPLRVEDYATPQDPPATDSCPVVR